MRAALAAAGVFCLSVATAFGADERNWMTATVRDLGKDVQTIYGGILLNGSSRGSGQYSGTATPMIVRQPVWTYAFETEEFVYVASHRLKYRWSKPCQVTVNQRVRIAPEGNTLYVFDERSTEHKLTIDKRVRRSERPLAAGEPSSHLAGDEQIPAKALARSAPELKRISVGMSSTQVESILGQPSAVVLFGDRQRWTYPDGLVVVFDGDVVAEVKF